MIGNGDITATYRLFGWVTELVCYSRRLSEAERIGIELYLNKKYNIGYPF